MRQILDFLAPASHNAAGSAQNGRLSSIALRDERYNIAMDLTLTELESAINFWRRVRPSVGEERALSPEVNALADTYALMIFDRARTRPLSSLGEETLSLIEAWRASAEGNAA